MQGVHLIDSPRKVDLRAIDPGDTQGLDKDAAKDLRDNLGDRLDELEDLLYFAGQTSLLIVLQGMDTAGKDGTIRRLLKYCNAQSCHVHPFKVPTEEELAHDFLWRIHHHTPGKGSMAIFNRSHYEDVLVTRVHGWCSDELAAKRFEHINAFERLLADSGTVVLKFFLLIDKDEQKERLLDREKETEKAWKLSVGDWEERERWDDYIRVYEEAIAACSAPHAPWHVVPANHKWFRDVCVLKAIVDALEPHAKGWMSHLASVGEQAKKELAEYRASQ